MSNLYLTQDVIGHRGSGGAVTANEYAALQRRGGELHPIDGARVNVPGTPFQKDAAFLEFIKATGIKPEVAHIYAGCFSQTVRYLRELGCRVSYTCAAHDVDESRREHQELGLPFDLPHLNDPAQWKEYLQGYLDADLLICPSTRSADLLRKYGRVKAVEVIPHGWGERSVEPDGKETEAIPTPAGFAVGYMGQAGPDKGLRYLFEAWRKLGYKDAELVIAGRNEDQVLPLWRRFGGGRLRLLGYVASLEEFYRQINVYVQPSVTEGFGMEIVEALAHGRQVIASRGAGASELLVREEGREWYGAIFEPRDVEALCSLITKVREKEQLGNSSTHFYLTCHAADYTWDRIVERYERAWRKHFGSLGT